MSTTRLFLVFLMTALIAGCGSRTSIDSTGDNAFKNLYPNCEMNSTIQFLPIEGDHRSGALINLNIRNTSKDSVIFPDDFNVKILYFDSNDQDWVEIKNNLHSVPSSDPYSILEPANSGLKSYSVVLIIPSLSGNVIIDARVVIIGNVYRENAKANECVGAFIDIQILPE